ncbi:MAG: EamA family transporter [Mailhella sp.]|nr:EamA family transporter [Mailhella sp.]
MKNSSVLGGLFVLIGALCFSTTGFTQALIVDDGASSYAIGTIRMTFGGLLLLALSALRGNLPTRKGWDLKCLFLTVFGVGVYQLCFFKGTLQAGVAMGTLAAMGFTPVVAAILSALFYKTVPSRQWYVSTLIGVTGLILMNWGKTGDFNPGALFFPLAAGACYGFTLTFSKPLLKVFPAETAMSVVLLICGACMLPGMLTEDLSWMLTTRGVLATLHLGVVATAMAYFFTIIGLKMVTPPTAATLSLAEPVGAALLGILILGEAVSGTSFIGIALIIASALLLVIWPEKQH